jgi:hypothetical protein
MKFGAAKCYGHSHELYLNYFFYEAGKNGGAKFGVYVRTNAEPLCV